MTSKTIPTQLARQLKSAAEDLLLIQIRGGVEGLQRYDSTPYPGQIVRVYGVDNDPLSFRDYRWFANDYSPISPPDVISTPAGGRPGRWKAIRDPQTNNNTAQIAQNTSDIAQNASDISSLSGDFADHINPGVQPDPHTQYRLESASHPATLVSVTPTGNISSVTAQLAIIELDNEKVAKAGDTMTGDLSIDRAAADPTLNLKRGTIPQATFAHNNAANALRIHNVNGAPYLDLTDDGRLIYNNSVISQIGQYYITDYGNWSADNTNPGPSAVWSDWPNAPVPQSFGAVGRYLFIGRVDFRAESNSSTNSNLLHQIQFSFRIMARGTSAGPGYQQVGKEATTGYFQDRLVQSAGEGHVIKRGGSATIAAIAEVTVANEDYKMQYMANADVNNNVWAFRNASVFAIRIK